MRNHDSEHTFYIPVLGLAYSVDSPLKVARFGIASVMSIVDDRLLEQMRAFHSQANHLPYELIPVTDVDHRALRVTAYLDMIKSLVEKQLAAMQQQPFEEGNDICRYFEMLPDSSPSRELYLRMLKATGEEKEEMKEELRKRIIPGDMNVNIMTKVDKLNGNKGEMLPVEFADALSALRGFANSSLRSSVVFSAGLNPRLYSYCATLPAFLPDESGVAAKKIILKVSDYRSAAVQGKFLAKKGLFVSEFRIESGLNCGGHAFPTEGHLLGPILEEFSAKRNELRDELLNMCNAVLAAAGKPTYATSSNMRLTVQGGIGTMEEDTLLRETYGADATGWGSPFLLVPEATNVDDPTLNDLAHAEPGDYFLSHASPLGVPFNNFRKSSANSLRRQRIIDNRPGSPCKKKYLVSNTEFTTEPICVASRQYQNLKLAQLESLQLPREEHDRRFGEITEKECLCEGLAVPVLRVNNMQISKGLDAVSICPGPNLAFFSGVFTLRQMVDHIYGRTNLLNKVPRPHMFVNELKLYVNYLKEEVTHWPAAASDKQLKWMQEFKTNLVAGMKHYTDRIALFANDLKAQEAAIKEEIATLATILQGIQVG